MKKYKYIEVSISERLPDKYGKYLVITESGSPLNLIYDKESESCLSLWKNIAIIGSKKKEYTLQEELNNYIALDNFQCKWKRMDMGSMGFSDYVYKTTCGLEFDEDKITKMNFCPNCGGKITN